jgi:hypothetical protein
MPKRNTSASPLVQVETPNAPAWWGLADKHKTIPIDESLDFTNGMICERLGVNTYKAHRIIKQMIQRGEIDAGRMVGKYRWYRVLKHD